MSERGSSWPEPDLGDSRRPPVPPPAGKRSRGVQSWVAIASTALAAAGFVGAYLLGVAHGRSSAPPAQPLPGSATAPRPAQTAPRPTPADAVLLSRCLSTVEPKHLAAAAGAQVRLVFADDRGYLVWIGNKSFDKHCGYRWDGSADPVNDASSFGVSLPNGYSTFGTVDLYGRGTAVAEGLTVREVNGIVARGVQQVRVRWFDGPTVNAVVHHQYFYARSVEPATGDSLPSANCVLEAYGTKGELLRRQDCD